MSDKVYTIGQVTGTDSTGSPAALTVQAQGEHIIFSVNGHEVFLDSGMFDELDEQMQVFERSEDGEAWLNELEALEKAHDSGNSVTR